MCYEREEAQTWHKGSYPDIEVQVLVGNRLDVESDCWNRCDHFADLPGPLC